MTDKIQLMTITILTTILFTGGIVPYSFANNYDDDDEYYECETPSIFKVMYNGPDGADVEIYKQPKHARDGVKMLHAFPNSFNNGEYIELNSEQDMGREKLKSKTTYKIMNGGSETIIPIDTSCKRPMAIGDTHEKDGITLTVDYGGDLDSIPVIFSKYHVETPNEQQVCDDPSIFIDFTSPSPSGLIVDESSVHADIVDYLADYGITYSVESGNLDIGAVYDSRPPTGADPDLENPRPVLDEIKNLLIVQEHAQPSPPDDKASGGTHFMGFVNPVDLNSFRVVDIEGSESGSVTGDNGAGTVPFPHTGDNNHDLMDTELAAFVGVSNVEFDLSSSGAITNICFTPTVIPVTGSIEIVKETNPSEIVDRLFVFSGDLEAVLDTDSNTAEIPDRKTFPGLSLGPYTITETVVSGFETPMIDCTGAADFEAIDNTVVVTIDEDNLDASCTFTNVQIPPTGKLTLKKALTVDNGGDALIADFEMNVTNVDTGVQTTITHGAAATLDAGTYTLKETIVNPAIDPEDYSFVLIAGDTECPSMVEDMETFEVNEGDNITCVIYNDDDFVPGGVVGDDPKVNIAVQVFNLPGVSPNQFTYLIDDDPVSNGGFATFSPNTSVIFNQTNYIGNGEELIVPTSIQGDGNCPEVLGMQDFPNGIKHGEITLNVNQEIECIVVYGEPSPIFFHRNSFTITFDGFATITGEDDQIGCENPDERNACLRSSADSGFTFVLEDPAITSDTTTFLVNFIPTNGGFDAPNCAIKNIATNGPAFDLALECLNFFAGDYIVNYVLFESDVPL